jgi:hypothetical protein
MLNLSTIYFIIWFTIYVVIWLATLIDADMNNLPDFSDNLDYIIWGAAILLCISLFIIGVLTVLHVKGYQFEKFGARGLILSGIVVVLLLVGLFLFQQWNTYQTYNNIREKARRRVYRPLTYQYGRDSQDLARQFQIRQSEVLNRIEPQSLHELWERLMVESPGQVTRLLTEILSNYPQDTPDVHYNLLWYLCIANEPLRNNLSRAEIRYILSLDHPTLLQLVRDGVRPIPTLQTRYDGLTDRASLIFTLLSGYYIPAVENLNRYDDVKKYSPHIVYNLAFNQYQIINHTDGTYQVYPPYVYVAQQPESPVEKIITQITPENCDKLIQAYGIATIESFQSLSFPDKLRRIQQDLSSYHHVFTRPEGMILPPALANMTDQDIYTILSYYTNLELVDHYEPRLKWNNRNQLMRIIHDDIVGIPKWSILARNYCNNDSTMNIITGESHGEINKNDPDDPTLSYGIQKNYQCYQASELEGSFREYDGIFQFRIPDYLPENGGPSVFPVESIKQLQKIILDEANHENLLGLLKQIQIGLQATKSARVRTYTFKQEYDRFNSQQQMIIRKYLAWMFVYSMWMRFWKGPGYPWPLKKVMVEYALTRAIGKRASPQERDEHVFIQDGIRTRIIEMAESDPDLIKWINELVAVHYDFANGDSHCASYTIKEKMDQIALGSECMGFGSDIILKTSYYYILYILGIEEGPAFDSFIYNQLPDLLQLEQQVITAQLQNIIGRDNPNRVQVLNGRLDAIAHPLPIQSPFNPKLYETNVHV